MRGLFRDRFHAGQCLAKKLRHFRGTDGLLVLGLPCGGVPVAFEVAKGLKAPLDLFLVRKLGLPGQRELALGAISTGGVRVLNRDVVRSCQLSQEVIDHVAGLEQRELERQERVFRHERPLPEIGGHVVILVDDGLATGSTMQAAVEAARQQRPRRLVVAVPVGAAETCEAMKGQVEEVICVVVPEDFTAVGAYYEDFSPTSDEMVIHLLKERAYRDFEPEAQ